jgi:hypothetical protein
VTVPRRPRPSNPAAGLAVALTAGVVGGCVDAWCDNRCENRADAHSRRSAIHSVRRAARWARTTARSPCPAVTSAPRAAHSTRMVTISRRAGPPARRAQRPRFPSDEGDRRAGRRDRLDRSTGSRSRRAATGRGRCARAGALPGPRAEAFGRRGFDGCCASWEDVPSLRQRCCPLRARRGGGGMPLHLQAVLDVSHDREIPRLRVVAGTHQDRTCPRILGRQALAHEQGSPVPWFGLWGRRRGAVLK